MCVTNRVTPQRVADVLLAAGASPAMVDNPDEVHAFSLISKAVYVNTGLHQSQVAALERIASTPTPVILDPVGFGATSYRNEAISDFLSSVKRLTVIKGNANEICGLGVILASFIFIEFMSKT